ncbi:acyl carrier protein [Streptomyces flavofungini]|uniref:acyl carrier protein n=1 Tax=Streptomyces flavofungini TaxID=68200 RepID=UPI0034DECAA1
MSTAQEITPELVARRLRGTVADLLEMAPAEIDSDVPLSAFGIDSMTSAALVDDVEKWFGVRLPHGGALGRLSLAEAADEVVTEVAGGSR